MQGPSLHDKEMKGLTPRMIDELYSTIEMMPETTEFLIQLSITEIYKEKLRDLLDVTQTNLKIRESGSKGIYIDGVTEKYAATQSDVWSIMEHAYSNRVVGHTNMNAGSSRSHLIVMLSIYQNDKLVQNVEVLESRPKGPNCSWLTWQGQKRSRRQVLKVKDWKKLRRLTRVYLH
jgi:kinesin family protein 5